MSFFQRFIFFLFLFFIITCTSYAQNDSLKNKAYQFAKQGMELIDKDHLDEAITAFDKVRSLDPNYPNLAANRRIAEQSRDAAAPWYAKNAPVLGIIVLAIAGALVWFLAVRKKY